MYSYTVTAITGRKVYDAQGPSKNRWRNLRVGYIALTLVVVHLVVLGIRGWLAPQGWNAGIPPVSLVAVVAALVPLLVKRRLEHDKKERAAKRATTRDNE